MKTLTLALAALALTVAASGTAAGPGATTTTYTVGSSMAPGADTGMVLKKKPVTVTATGNFCPFGAGGVCYTPDGAPSVDTTHSVFGAFVLPGAPAYGLIARVGTGAWTWVGSGPTSVSGVGDLQFAVNDDHWPDNAGGFVVTVSSSQKGSSKDCWPGWGYGDTNHVHCGPPGQNKKQSEPANGDSTDHHGNSDEHGHGGKP